MNIDGQIQNRLKQLKLAGILDTLPVRLKQAEQSNSGYLDFLSTLLEDEYERRQAGSLLKRLKKAGFEEEKTIEGFDFSFNPQLPAKRIKQLGNCAYIDKRENIFLIGPVGVGKTHIAQAFGHIACRMGYDTLYAKAANMFRYLHSGRADNSLDIRIRRYTSMQLLIIDDFYEVVSQRYIKKSTIFTSNRSLEDWQGLFPDPVISNPSSTLVKK